MSYQDELIKKLRNDIFELEHTVAHRFDAEEVTEMVHKALRSRVQLNPKDIEGVIAGIRAQIEYEVSPARKGKGAFVSTHEVLGTLEEEHHELIDAVKSNDIDHVIDELRDIAVVCVWGMLSLQNIQEDNNAVSTNQTT